MAYATTVNDIISQIKQKFLLYKVVFFFFFPLHFLWKLILTIIYSGPVGEVIRMFDCVYFNCSIRAYMKQRYHWSSMPLFSLVVCVRWIKLLKREISKIAGVWVNYRWKLQRNALICSNPFLSFTCIIGNISILSQWG